MWIPYTQWEEMFQ